MCRSGGLLVDGYRAAVDRAAAVTSKDGRLRSLAGASLLRFDQLGLACAA